MVEKSIFTKNVVLRMLDIFAKDAMSKKNVLGDSATRRDHSPFDVENHFDGSCLKD
jgi:hypothetical protein